MTTSFNLKSHKDIDESVLLINELKAFRVFRKADQYVIEIGDEILHVQSLSECIENIELGIKELKEVIWAKWSELADVSQEIVKQIGRNDNYGSNIDNLLFLSNAKRARLLCCIFTDLNPINKILEQVLEMDISHIDGQLIQQFNANYIEIKALHSLIMSEIYRIKLIKRYKAVTKRAQISGPWANLDLPTKERVWEWDEGEEEYFKDRQDSRREQIRYNPEQHTNGFYFVWQDHNRDPYKFTDMATDSPYKSRAQISIP